MIESIDAHSDVLADAGSPTEGPVTRLLRGAIRREPWTDHGGVSGSPLERVELADGTRIVIKHLARDLDWIMRVTDDYGRAAQLADGVLDRVASIIDDAVLAVEPEEGGWIIAMRDVSAAMLSLQTSTTRSSRLRVLRAVAGVHDAFRGECLGGLVSLVDRYGICLPEPMERAGSRFVSVVRRGWDVFEGIGPAEVVRAATAIRDHPELLAAQLERCPQTLIHGDLKHANIGLLPDRVVLLDWSMAGIAPPEVDFTYYLIKNMSQCDESLDELFADVQDVMGECLNSRAMDLAVIGAFVQWAWSLALSATGERQNWPGLERSRGEAQYAWWLAHVERAFETWSPV